MRLQVVLNADPSILLDPADRQLSAWQLAPSGEGSDLHPSDAQLRPDVVSAQIRTRSEEKRLKAAWWDLFGPTVQAEYRLEGLGGDVENHRLDSRSAFSSTLFSDNPSAAGFVRRLGPEYIKKHDADDFSNGLKRNESYGIGISWNLSLKKFARTRENRSVLKRAELQAQIVEAKALGEIQTARQDIETTLELIALAQDELYATERNHRLSFARFRAGTALALEVLNAQGMLAQSRLNLASHIIDFNLAQAHLLSAQGLVKAEPYLESTMSSLSRTPGNRF